MANTLGRAVGVDATQGDFIIELDNIALADGAVRGEFKGNRISGTLFENHAIHCGNHIAMFGDFYPVAHADILGLHHIGIVKRGTRDDRTRQRGRRQFSNRGQNTCAANLNGDAVQTRFSKFRCVLIGACKTWCVGRATELRVERTLIDLNHGTINFKGEGVTTTFQFVQGLKDLFHRHAQPLPRRRLESPSG